MSYRSPARLAVPDLGFEATTVLFGTTCSLVLWLAQAGFSSIPTWVVLAPFILSLLVIGGCPCLCFLLDES